MPVDSASGVREPPWRVSPIGVSLDSFSPQGVLRLPLQSTMSFNIAKSKEEGVMLKKQHIYLILFCIMIVWGFNVIATKILVTSFMPVTMTSIRIFTAGVSVFIILYFFKQVRLFTKQELPYILIGALLNVVGHHYFLSVGLTKTSASNGGLILGIGPLATTILAVIFLGNKITFSKTLGLILGLSGISFIVLEGDSGLSGISIGDFFIFLSIALQAGSFILIKKVSETIDPRLLTGYMLVVGSMILFVISLFVEPTGLEHMKNGSVGLWSLFFASAIIATAIGHMVYNYAIGQVGAAETSIFINLNPFFALVGSVVFLNEKIVYNQILGFILILLGVLLGSGALEEFKLVTRRYKVIRANKSTTKLM